MKHYVRLIRPVFETAVVEFDAKSSEEAEVLACDLVEQLSSEEWVTHRDEQSYVATVDGVVAQEEVREEDLDSGHVWSRTAYALLRADLEAMEGQLLVQPWMLSVSRLGLADFAGDWTKEAELLSKDGVRAWHDELSQSGDAIRGLGRQLIRRMVTKNGHRG